MEWSPISRSELEALIAEQLKDCTQEQREVFERFRVPLRETLIFRLGNWDEVFVVAMNGNEALYYEDVEEGFNFSPLCEEGTIARPGWNQEELKYALQHWLPKSS